MERRLPLYIIHNQHSEAARQVHRGLSRQIFYRNFNGCRDFFESVTAKYRLGCMPIVKNQSNLIIFFIRHPFCCLIKRICSKLSINTKLLITSCKFSRYLERIYKALSFLFIPHYVRNPKSDY